MRRLYDDLWQTTLYKAGGPNTHAYFLTRDEGNILLYNTGNDKDLEQIAELGGITHQYLSHRDEAAPSLCKIKALFRSKLCADVLEEPFISNICKVDTIISEREVVDKVFEIIPTAGHTAGGLSYLYHSPKGKRYLFTGDTFFQFNGKWSTFDITNAGGDKGKLIQSLSILRGLAPDVVLCSGFIGEASVVEVNDDEWKKAIDDTIDRLST